MQSLLTDQHSLAAQRSRSQIPNSDIHKIFEILEQLNPNPAALILQAYHSLKNNNKLAEPSAEPCPSHMQRPRNKNKYTLNQEDQRISFYLNTPPIEHPADNPEIIAPQNTYYYIYKQQFPTFHGRHWTLSVQPDTYYDIPPSTIPPQSTISFWKWQEKRLMAQSFCQWGYGVDSYRKILTDQRYTVRSSRLKEVIFGIIREALNHIQEYGKKIFKQKQLCIPAPVIRVLSTKLFYPYRYLHQQQVATLLDIIRMHYFLPCSPVTKAGFQALYGQIIDKFYTSKQYSLRCRLDQLCEYEIGIKEEEGQLWNKDLERVLAISFLVTKSFEDTKNCLENAGHLNLKGKLTVADIRQRLQIVIKATLRKVNYLMELVGVQRRDRIKNHKELIILAKSSKFAEIHSDLLHFFLNPSLMDSSAVIEFYIKLKRARQMLYLFKLQNENGGRSKPPYDKVQQKDPTPSNQQNINVLKELFSRYQAVKELKRNSLASKSSPVYKLD